MSKMINRKPGIERRAVLLTILANCGVVIAHLVAAVVRRALPELPLAAWPITLGTIAIAGILALAVPRLAKVLPTWLDGAAKSHPIKATLLAVLALLAVAQTARISTHMTDPNTPWWILTKMDFWTQHECGTAYFHAAELHDRGEENIYHANHYPVLNRNIEPHSEIEGMKVEDAFQGPSAISPVA